MKILIIDTEDMCVDFAIRCIADGHQVKVFMRKDKGKTSTQVGQGIFEKVSHWEPFMNWADLIFCTGNSVYSTLLSLYQKKGYPIFGANSAGTEWEENRQTGTNIFKKIGIPTLPQTKFTNYDDAINFVISTKKRYVSKPSGDNDAAKELSYVSKSPEDMIFMLQKWKKSNKLHGDFILQEFHKGIEMAVGCWFGSSGFSRNICENWEFKKLMNEEIGPNTGEQGTILRYTEKSLLAEKVLFPLTDLLHGINYIGYIDVNCIIDDSGTPWPLEFTMRPGWPLYNIQESLHKGDTAEWMLDLIDGRDTLKVSSDIACGVIMSIPDYPYNKLKTSEETQDYPLFYINELDVLKDYHLNWVKRGKVPKLENNAVVMEDGFVTAGTIIATVTGNGATVKQAKEKAYEHLKKIYIPNSVMYRTDIGCRLEEQLPKLHALGYCKDIRYG